ncbi:PAS domain-containing sensor histidine kinase [Aridibaculum aurantiacum]|uniref:PAS domain-containing sensor histidine kinase n=1 Tax=Aridibaculum aurantiacum TaxID=2810307 RepID=UPI001A975EA6|nr:PAS domain S-box protein [Aridibaculum aurantiacum]
MRLTISANQPASIELFEVLVQQSTDVYQLADAGFIINYTSNAVENVLGYAPHHFIGKSVLEAIHPDDRDNVKEWLISLRAIKERLVTLEYRVKNKEGDWVWIENNGRNMLDHPHVGSIVMNFRNIQSKKIADHALVQAEQRLSMLLNNTEESFIIVNSRLRIITYNKAAQVHSPFFFQRELQSGLSVLELIKKEEINELIEVFEIVFTGEEVVKETVFTDENHHVHIYNHTYRPLFDQNGEIFGVFITSTNITERKKLTEELAANSNRLETAQQIARLGYFENNFTNKEIFCSPQFYEILGIQEAEATFKDFNFLHQVVHPEDKELLRNALENSFSTGESFNIEFRVTGEKEKVILAIGVVEKDADGLPTKFRVTIQDITDSKMAILAIQTLESRFRSLFENSIDGVILSKWEGAITSGNPSICKMLGYTSDELLSLTRHDLLQLESPLVQEMMDQREKTGSYMGELMIRHKDGYYIPAEVTSMMMKDGEGHNYISSIIRDITEKKKIEKEQKALTEELLKNNQDLQQFSFITSHNLRAPVANLMSLLSLYNKSNPGDDFNLVLVDKFAEATQQLNQTLNDLVNVLVIKSNNNISSDTVFLSAVFADVLKNVESLLEQQHGVINTDFSAVDEIRYNRIHVESIFLNMISNAIRYRSADRKPVINIRSYVVPGYIVVDFNDNGMGMDLKRYGDRLFGLYQRFHDNREGKGLGLYMTRSQVMAMGGKIEVESEPGVGSTFKVFFKSL